MAGYRLSRKAERQLADIYAYSLLTFGERQADTYFLDLHRAFDLIQANPTLGRAMTKAGMRRLPHRRHTVFYVAEKTSVLIVDILGAGQDPSRHL